MSTTKRKNKKDKGKDAEKNPRLQWLPSHLRKFVKCKVTNTKINDDLYEIRTFSVFPCSASGQVRRYGPDDQTYIINPELVELVPRGFSELWLNKKCVLTLRGPSKFDGTTAIDEDDVDINVPTSQHGILNHNKIERWANAGILQVEFQEKANGKFAIFTLFEHNRDFYIFGGSKNVHVVCKIGKPGTFEIDEESEELHYRILRDVVKDLNKLSDEDIFDLLNKTVVGEYVDGMHMVWTEKPYLVYFSVPGEIKLPMVKNVLPSQNYLPTPEQLHTIRGMKNVEGVVICYKNVKTGEIFRQKHKSIWYILIRCWREIMSKKDEDVDTTLLIDALQRRTHERSDQFLHLSDEELLEYDNLASALVKWISASKYTYKDTSPFRGIGIGRMFHEFTLDPDAPPTNVVTEKKNFTATPEEILTNPKLFYTVVELPKYGNKVCVILRGLPGCGKTTIANQLEEELNVRVSRHIRVSRHCTDDYFMVGTEYVHDVSMLKEYHERNYNAFAESTAQVKINENTNTAKWEYDRYLKSARNDGYVCVVLECKTAPVHELALRNSHEVSVQVLKKMLKRFKPAVPMYYGVFVSDDGMMEKVTQKTPLHMTCAYIGENKKKDHSVTHSKNLLGATITLRVVGISTNEAGTAAVIESPIPTEAKCPHITLHTRDGYSPYQVGESISKENIDYDIVPYDVEGVYAVMY